MNGSWGIALKDWREAARDGRVWLAWLLALSALALAALQGAVTLRQNSAEHAIAASQVRGQWEAQGEKNPHSAAHFGQFVFKPVAAPALIDPGVNADAGQAIWLDPHRRNLARHKPTEDQSPAERLARAGIVGVLQWVLPLLVVVLGFGAVAGEREAGTWRMLVSLGMTPCRLFVGKLAGLAWVLVPLWGFFFAVLVWVAWGNGSQSTDALIRVIGLALLYTVYMVIFGLMALGISARTVVASRALALLLVLWGINGLVAPRLGATLAQAAVGLPSTEAFHAAIQRDIQFGMDQDGDTNARQQQFLKATLSRYGISRAEDLPVGLRGLHLLDNDAYSSRVHEKHFQDLESRYIAQTRWQLWASAAGPLVPVRAISQALAGTDIHHHVHFATAAETYRRSFVDATSERILHGNQGTGNDATGDNAFWASIAPFTYHAPAWSWSLQQQGPALMLLLTWFLGAAWFAISGLHGLARRL